MDENARVKELRKSLGLTLEKFGQKIGVGKSAISDIERGRNNVSDQMRRSICREFGVREEWLRTGEGSMRTARGNLESLEADIRRFLTIEDGSFKARLVSLLLRLPEEEWETLEHYAHELVDGNLMQTETDSVSEPEIDEAIEADVAEYRAERYKEKEEQLQAGSSSSAKTG